MSTTAPNQHQYAAKAAGLVTLRADGAHVAGDVTESNVAAGATAHTLHIEGDVTCGATVTR